MLNFRTKETQKYQTLQQCGRHYCSHTFAPLFSSILNSWNISRAFCDLFIESADFEMRFMTAKKLQLIY